jgi:pimeloyl-ACP methyl ester carboxylesterase
MKKQLKRISIIVVIFVVSLVFLGGVTYFGFPGFVVESSKYIARWSAGLEKKEVLVGDHHWVYLEGGEGDSILFLHGFGMHKDFWGNMLKDFGSSYRIIAPDLPGFGENSRIDSAIYDIPSQVERLDRFVKKVGLKSFHIVGFSMGGGISAYYVSKHPEKVKSLSLIAPYGVSSSRKSDFYKNYDETGENLLVFKTPEQYNIILESAFHQPPSIPEHFKAYIAEIGASNYDFHNKITQDLVQGGRDVLDSILPKIEAHTLIIWGKNDRIFDVSSVKTLESGIKNSQTVIIEKAGHMVYIEKAEQVKKAYSEFLSNLR